MRLAIINQFYVPDVAPTGHLAASLAEHRARQGDVVTVVTGRGAYLGGSSDGARRETGVRVRRLWTPGLGKGRTASQLTDYAAFHVAAAARMATLQTQDVIVSLTTPPYVVAAALLHKLLHRRTRVILWNMDCYPEALEADGLITPGGPVSRFLRTLNRRLFRYLDRVVCLDGAMRERVGAYLPDPIRCTVIPNWEEAAMFDRPPTFRPWSEYDSPDLRGRLVLLYLGNTGRGHDFDTILVAARELRDDPVVFLFVGGGSAWQRLETARHRDGLDNVVLRGYVPKDRTPEVLAGADFALITMREAMRGVVSPSKLHSSLAMGLPIVYVGPEDTNVDEAVRDFDCGISLRPGQVDALVAFVRRLSRDPALHGRHRQNARLAFDERYSDAVVLPQLDRVINGDEA